MNNFTRYNFLDILKLATAIVVCEAAGAIGSLFTISVNTQWYADLAQPVLAPPSWLFAPVWVTLFALMGISLFLVWRQHSNNLPPSLEASEERGDVGALRFWKIGMALFFLQLILNVLWSAIFFGMKNPGAAFGEIIILWLAILATAAVFYKISKPAAWLLVPYLLWVGFAGYLNFSIWQLQKNNPEPVFCTMEARLCPDGSYVGRVGPNCEFAQCPGVLSVADQLRECLPKSDLASHAKCEELLAAITDFGECVNAGFAIMKSDPPQCALPDGRIFIDAPRTYINASWEQAGAAITECRAERIMQTHQRLVTVRLKAGGELIAREPMIDDVIKLAVAAASQCGQIIMGTE